MHSLNAGALRMAIRLLKLTPNKKGAPSLSLRATNTLAVSQDAHDCVSNRFREKGWNRVPNLFESCSS